MQVPQNLRDRVDLPGEIEWRLQPLRGACWRPSVLLRCERVQCGADRAESEDGLPQVPLPGQALVDGKVSWGSNEYGQVSGDAAVGDAVATPRQVPIPDVHLPCSSAGQSWRHLFVGVRGEWSDRTSAPARS